MAKLNRVLQKIFGSTSGANQIAQFGSYQAGTPTFSTDPSVIQSLSNYLTGWFAAVNGSYSPAIEDMNALHYLFSYQLAYLMQAGISEWDATTTYYIGSLVNDGTGRVYSSLIDTNLNQPVTDTSKWRCVQGVTVSTINPSTQSPYSLGASDNGKTFLVDSSLGAMQFNLPAPVLNYSFKIKDSGFNFSINNCTIHRNGSEKIENLASDYICMSNGGIWEIASDGTNWFIIGR